MIEVVTLLFYELFVGAAGRAIVGVVAIVFSAIMLIVGWRLWRVGVTVRFDAGDLWLLAATFLVYGAWSITAYFTSDYTTRVIGSRIGSFVLLAYGGYIIVYTRPILRAAARDIYRILTSLIVGLWKTFH